MGKWDELAEKAVVEKTMAALKANILKDLETTS